MVGSSICALTPHPDPVVPRRKSPPRQYRCPPHPAPIPSRNSVAERRHELDLALMPGVEDVLRHLAQKGALLGVATGNLEAIGWIKIEKAGLREWFRFGGFSDYFPIRGELIAHAAWKAREMAGRDATVCVVGDTPRDIEAAHSNFLPVIAVATGRSSFDELLEAKPEACVSSLADLLATLKGRS